MGFLKHVRCCGVLCSQFPPSFPLFLRERLLLRDRYILKISFRSRRATEPQPDRTVLAAASAFPDKSPVFQRAQTALLLLECSHRKDCQAAPSKICRRLVYSGQNRKWGLVWQA